MKLALFAPYGSINRESHLLFLLASYLRQLDNEVVSITCNGIASGCDRDRLTRYRRELLTCARCTCDQSSLAHWAGVSVTEASRYLSPEEITTSRRLITELRVEELFDANYSSLNLIELCRYSLFHRLGGVHPELARRDHERMVREHLTTALRVLLVGRNFLTEVAPDLTLVLGGQDVLSRSYVTAAVERDHPVVLFQQGAQPTVVKAIHPKLGRVLSLELELADVRQLKVDLGAWPADVLISLEEMAVNLKLVDSQIPLPIAR